jgi:WD40 repeat protein
LIGLKTSDIVEIDEKSSDSQSMSLVFGHGEGQLWALSPHPIEPMFATGSYDRNLVVWNISTKVNKCFYLFLIKRISIYI